MGTLNSCHWSCLISAPSPSASERCSFFFLLSITSDLISVSFSLSHTVNTKQLMYSGPGGSSTNTKLLMCAQTVHCFVAPQSGLKNHQHDVLHLFPCKLQVYNSSLPPSSYSQLKQSCLFKKPLYWSLDEEQGAEEEDDDEGYWEEETEDREDLMDQVCLNDQDDLERDTEELCNDIMLLTFSCGGEEGEEKEEEKREENESKVESWEEKDV